MRRPGSGAGGPASTSGSDRREALAGGPGPAGGADAAAARGKGRGDKKPAAGSMRTPRHSACRAGSGFRPAPAARGAAWFLYAAIAPGIGESPAFLSMNACPLPGVSSYRAPPLSWQQGLERPRLLLGPTSPERSSPSLGVLKGHSSCSGLKGTPVELVTWQV